MPDATQHIDLNTYPIDGSNPEGFAALIADIQAQLDADGCAVLRDFIKPESLPLLVAEADAVADKGHRSFNRTNVYFTQDDPSLPETHPMRQFYERSNAFIPADNFRENSILRAIYEYPLFAAFVKQALNEDNFFRYADPLADVIINAAEEGNGFPWHFDTNNYTVTLAIQNAEEGGEFEYAPNFRTSTDENYPGVSDVLNETSDQVKTLRLHPGDLPIFKGRYSLHRVCPLKGPIPRYVAIFSYVEQEGMVGSPERTRQLYGRVLPIHKERAGPRADALID